MAFAERGAGGDAIELAAKHVDAYLTRGEPPAQVAEKIADVTARAATYGRKPRFGIRLNVIARESDTEAWADRLISKLTEEEIAASQAKLARMEALHGGRRDTSQTGGAFGIRATQKRPAG